MVCICANVVVMSMRHLDQPDDLADFQLYANYGFVSLFALEALLKITAYGKLYFKSGWNKFDFFLVALSLPGLAVGSTSVQSFRILRVARILRLIKKASVCLLFKVTKRGLGSSHELFEQNTKPLTGTVNAFWNTVLLSPVTDEHWPAVVVCVLQLRHCGCAALR